MRWIRAVIIAFSTYSRVPMPQIKRDSDAMELAIAFLPLAGIAVGLAIWGWQLLCVVLEFSPVLFAVIAVALPIVITGGIHMDGYCDTADALASMESKARRLEILKDPHAGAFALIRCSVYMLVCFGIFHEIYLRELYSGIMFLYSLSRCLAVWSIMTMPNARKEGMLVAFTAKTDRKKVGFILAVFMTISLAGWLYYTFPYGLAGLLLCIPVTLWYRYMMRKNFGGATGDTTGFYIQIIELTLLAGLLIGELGWNAFF